MQLWTLEHFVTIVPAVIIMILITIVLSKVLGNKPHHIRMIPFQILAVILLLSEIIKQVLSIINGYDLYHIPLHVCSLFIFFIPLTAFYNKKGSEVINLFTCTICVSIALFMLIYPNIIYSKENIANFFNNYFDFHTVFFHNLILLEFILIVGLNLYSTKGKKYLKHVVIASIIYSSTAALMAQILKTNFSNFYSCNIEVVNNLVLSVKESIGNILGQALYVLILLILHVGFFTTSYYIYTKVEKLQNIGK
jgi:hypothetical protein